MAHSPVFWINLHEYLTQKANVTVIIDINMHSLLYTYSSLQTHAQ